MAFTLSPPPLQDQVIDKDGLMTVPFYKWLRSLIDRIQSSTVSVVIREFAAQTAAIALTTLAIQASAGIYRVSWTLRVTTAAGVSSAVQVFVSYLQDDIALQQVGPSETGNTGTTVQSGSLVLKSDASGPIAFSTSYASVGGTMVYSVSVVMEKIG